MGANNMHSSRGEGEEEEEEEEEEKAIPAAENLPLSFRSGRRGVKGRKERGKKRTGEKREEILKPKEANTFGGIFRFVSVATGHLMND